MDSERVKRDKKIQTNWPKRFITQLTNQCNVGIKRYFKKMEGISFLYLTSTHNGRGFVGITLL